MTTSVKVTAHCASTKEVEVRVLGTQEFTVLQNGESREFFVYDARTVEVKEVEKVE